MGRLVIDMMGRRVTVPDQPQRIISLVPSQTELLYHLGLSEQIVGVTKFCVHPETARRQASVVGGTKQLDINRVLALQPDLIIGNKEENDRDSMEELAARTPVWLSDIQTLDDARHMIQSVGRLVDREATATALSGEIQSLFDLWLAERDVPTRTVLYLIWARPWMGVATATFIDHMLDLAGFENVLSTYSRYPVLAEEELHQLDPDLVLLSSEPFPFKNDHAQQIAQAFPNAQILPVDGELFSWYGSRLLQTPAYFRSLSDRIKMN